MQTLIYGLFAAWVPRCQNHVAGRFDWKTAACDLQVPMISALFEQLSQPTKLKALDLTTVLDRAADALNRVDQVGFFKTAEPRHSMPHFYEPFLKALDPSCAGNSALVHAAPERGSPLGSHPARRLGLHLGWLSSPQEVVEPPSAAVGFFGFQCP